MLVFRDDHLVELEARLHDQLVERETEMFVFDKLPRFVNTRLQYQIHNLVTIRQSIEL